VRLLALWFKVEQDFTTGKTLEQTDRNIRAAIKRHLKTLREFAETAPQPTTVAPEIVIQRAA